MIACFEDGSLPCSFHRADKSSARAQQNYLLAFRTILLITLLGALSSWCSNAFVKHQLAFSFCSASLLISALLATLFLKQRKFEDIWYVGRAVAESIKTRSWSFMMATDPYPQSDTDAVVTEKFIASTRKILKEKGIISFETEVEASKPEISDAMWSLRRQSLEVRLATYVQCRIADQKVWYAQKSRSSLKSERTSFLFMSGAQTLAVLVCVADIYYRLPTSGLVGVLASVTTSILAWLQVKKYQETGKAYEIASEELGLAEELAKCVSSEADLSGFIRDTESAVSREHTLWIARKRT